MDKPIVRSLSRGRFQLTREHLVRIGISAIGFFIGRVVILDMVNPVAIGFLSSLAGTGFTLYSAAIFMLLGIATRLTDVHLIRYIICVGLVCLADIVAHQLLLLKKNLYFTEFAQGLVASLCVLVGSIFSAWLGGSGILALAGLLESVLVFPLTFVLCKASAVLTSKRKLWLNNEEIISLAILSVCIIAGAADIYIGIVSLRYFLCFYFILLAAYLGDAGVAAAGGMLTGFLLLLIGVGQWNASMAVVLSIAGLGGGLFKSLGKPYVFAAFAISGGGTFYYLNRHLLTMEVFYSLSFAGMLFMVTPWKQNFNLTAQFSPAKIEKQDVSKLRDIAIERLKSLSQSFSQLGSVFAEDPVSDSRLLIGTQLTGVSGLIKNLAGELDDALRFREDLEKKVELALAKCKIDVDRISISENRFGRYEVRTSHQYYYKKKRWDKAVLKVVDTVLKRKFRISETLTNSTWFIEEKTLEVSCGTACIAKGRQTESGDSYSFVDLKNGQKLMVLSDGMGSGKRAHDESAATVKLLESFLESGFDKEASIKIINSMLLLNDSDESFATLDLCTIDLYTGDAEFVKLGAASSFLLRNGKVFIIESSSLPIGMLKDVDMDISKEKLYINDILIMVTDGMTNPWAGEDRKDWIASTLEKCNYENPQDIADYLLFEAKRWSDGKIRDDITVLVSRICEI